MNSNIPPYPCDICASKTITKVVYRTVLVENDSQEGCEYYCEAYKCPAHEVGDRCKSVKKWKMRYE